MEPFSVSSNSSHTLVQDFELNSSTDASANPAQDMDRKGSFDDRSGHDLGDDDDDEDSEESDDDGDEHYKVRHDDHWDEVIYWSPWTNWVNPGDGWPHNFMRSDEKLSGLRHEDLPSLKVSTRRNWKLPLFKDTATGDEYSLHLHLGLLVGLNQILCSQSWDAIPGGSTPWKRLAAPLYQVTYRRRLTDEATLASAPPLPKFIITLGKLAVRTEFRDQRETLRVEGENPPTETTDYLVVIDAADEDIPVWLLVSRSILRDRAEYEGRDHPQLPIFNGLLKDDSYGYDAACIFRSIRDLTGPTDFQEVCDLVRKTRAVVDPGLLNIGEEKMAELSGTTLPEGWSNSMPEEEIPSTPPKEIIDDHLGFDPADLTRVNTF
ncbi:hypothetical protein Daus18300_011050 [Diaporthe australafricana]|uniref:Uncharacterized protein n=1 Tax=Diaporthe australafricana TaxID=127596 RepID=A0ABR3W882_9PEZI